MQVCNDCAIKDVTILISYGVDVFKITFYFINIYINFKIKNKDYHIVGTVPRSRFDSIDLIYCV